MFLWQREEWKLLLKDSSLLLDYGCILLKSMDTGRCRNWKYRRSVINQIGTVWRVKIRGSGTTRHAHLLRLLCASKKIMLCIALQRQHAGNRSTLIRAHDQSRIKLRFAFLLKLLSQVIWNGDSRRGGRLRIIFWRGSRHGKVAMRVKPEYCKKCCFRTMICFHETLSGMYCDARWRMAQQFFLASMEYNDSCSVDCTITAL